MVKRLNSLKIADLLEVFGTEELQKKPYPRYVGCTQKIRRLMMLCKTQFVATEK